LSRILSGTGGDLRRAIRESERGNIFSDDDDRDNLFELPAALSFEVKTECCVRTLMLCHAHFLLRTGAGSLSPLKRRLLIGYAVIFN